MQLDDDEHAGDGSVDGDCRVHGEERTMTTSVNMRVIAYCMMSIIREQYISFIWDRSRRYA